MKSTNFLIAMLMVFTLTAFILPPVNAQLQQKVRGFSVTENLGTQANAAQETFYLDLRGWDTVDSVTVSVSASGEIDVDTVNFYVGNFTNDGFIPDAAGGVIYQAITLNLADGVTDFELLVDANDITVLTGAAIRGANGIKAVVEVGAAGNDATDTDQALYFNWRIHGTRVK